MRVERCFADTNLILRYLTNDVPAQADQVDELPSEGIQVSNLEFMIYDHYCPVKSQMISTGYRNRMIRSANRNW